MSDAAAVTTVILGIITLQQFVANRRMSRAKELADRAREIAERERVAVEAERRAEAERSSDILQQRKELAAEVTKLREWQGVENQRLKDLLVEARADTAKADKRAAEWQEKFALSQQQVAEWKDEASGWRAKYERETANNISMRVQIDEMIDRLNRMEGVAALPAARKRRSKTTVTLDTA